ncbi:hypothetical protein LWI28_028069 [Acer negundo]|uniref:DUF4283 domain-containing protein n=1 Tax=Acer negundo TaxID=4023 RepID=A0AAD5NZF2_ACENE|nr:hypothetical protein LWI28_028069 [Acer negundo]
MVDDEIAKLCANMSLLEKAGPVRLLQEGLMEAGAQRLALSLVGKILSSTMVNRDTFMGVMGRIWQVPNGMEIEFVYSNVFMFHFKKFDDRNRVLNGGPWTFDGALIALVIQTGKGDVGLMSFSSAEFWVQIHYVPLLCRTREIGWFIGSMVGNVKDVDMVTSREFLHVRVEIDILKTFQQCGCLGHLTHECTDGSLPVGSIEARELPFGAWLKASAPVKTWNRRCGVISGNHNPMQRRNQGGLDNGQPNWQPAAVVSIDQSINGKSSDGVFFRSDDNGDNDRSFVCSKERNNFRRGDPSNGFVFQTSHNILKGTRPGKIEMRERPKSNYKGKEKVDK